MIEQVTTMLDLPLALPLNILKLTFALVVTGHFQQALKTL
ncbi:hypothetical protein D051_0008 [Vibrio parahaemolyticus VPCR-2010]|nr:hypothetical protein D051_0008 [Vibrio parahaemolyticus VPCR-2010]